MKRFSSGIYYLLIPFTLLFVFSFFYIAKAQTLQTDSESGVPGINEQIDIQVSPVNPAPNTQVTITLAAYNTDLSRADISWLQNGSVVKNGIGVTSYSFNSGSAGTSKTIDIIILPQSGSKIEREITIRPASVDIAWESDSYTPPFYKGKALYPPEGNLIFVALPNLSENGVLLSSKNIVYTWSIDGTVLGSKSGYGKNTLTYSGTELDRPFTIDVTASSLDKTVTGQGELTMQSQNPSVLFYENSPLYGILFNQALSNQYALRDNEIDLSAYPFNFSTTNANSSVFNYSWQINGSPISLAKTQNKVTFGKTAGQTGQATVSLQLNSVSNILQSASDNLVINF